MLNKITNSFSETLAVIIADAKQLIKLKPLYINHIGLAFSGYLGENLKGFSIKMLQPFLIAKHHNTFINNY